MLGQRGRRQATDGKSLQPHTDVVSGTGTLSSKKELMRLLLAELTARNAADTVKLRLALENPMLGPLHDVTLRFRDMLRQRYASGFDDWVTTCTASSLKELQSLATRLQQDRTVILAAITIPWSNG